MTTSIQQDALLSQFSVLAYKDKAFLSNASNLPSGWELKADDQSPPFAAFAFQNIATGEVVIAYRGTNGLGDVPADTAIASGSWDPQFQQGLDFVAKVQGDRTIFPLGTDPSTLLVTGHSLGGAIAQIASQAYGLDGSTIDPGAAARIASTPEFQAACVAAGLPASGIGMPSSFDNWLVAGSLVSGGTGPQLGSVSYLPSLSFSSNQGLTTFALTMLNPAAGIAYMIGVDQFTNKHPSDQVSQALNLVAGIDDGSGASAGDLTLTPKIIGWTNDPKSGLAKPTYSQTEFEVKDQSGELQSTLVFSGRGTDRMLQVFDPSGNLQSTISQAEGGGIVKITPVVGPSIEIHDLPPLSATEGSGSAAITTRDSSGNILSITNTQTYDNGNTLCMTTNADGNGTASVADSTGTLVNQCSFVRTGGIDGTSGTLTDAVNGKSVVLAVDFSTGNVTGLDSINSQPLDTLGTGTYGLNADDYLSYGLTFDNLVNGTVPQTGKALITGLDPAAIAATGAPTPSVTTTDLGNGLTQRSIELGNGVTLSTVRNEDRLLISVSETTPAQDANGAVIPNTYDIVTRDGAGTITSTGKRIVNPIDASYTDTVISAATAQNPRGTLTISQTDAAGVTHVVRSPLSLSNLDIAATGFNDAYAIYNAIQSGNVASLTQGTLNSINDYSTITTGSGISEISLGANGLNAIMGLQGMNNALQQGDGLAFVASTANTITAGAGAYASAMGYTSTITASVAADGVVTTTTTSALDNALQANAADNVFGSAAGTIGTISQALPYLNIAVELEQGNVTGAVGQGVGIYLTQIGAVTGPVGAVIGLVVGYVLGDIFGDEPPVPWGSASAVWDPASGTIRINAVGENGGDAVAQGALGNLEGSLSNLTQYYNSQAQPDFQIGVIAQRLGGISYNYGSFHVSTIDPATGSALNPNLNFDATTGQTLNANVDDPVYFQSVGQYYINNALARQAIAPMWEVQTAKQQAANHLSNAGLSEVERAANLGHLAAALPTGATTESWNPIGIDLGGGLSTTALDTSAVQFNVDGTADLDARLTGSAAPQYLKQTQWLNQQDGFLVLDKNVSGSIDNAEELFSNAQVNAQSRGIASLATWDGDGNGLINASDAMFSQLAVWQDQNGDGRVQQSEYHHLSDLGITGLNYQMGTYSKSDSSVHQMATLTLQAQTQGNAYSAKPDGIQIDSSTGQSQLLVTQVHDLSSVQANEDGFTTDENVAAVMQLRGNGSTVQGLLDNDHVSNAPNAVLKVAGVQNAQGGTVSLDAKAGTVMFTPNVGFYGEAGFDYTVEAGAYGQTTAHVQVTVNHVNQAPHITGEQNTQTPIYGYTLVTTFEGGHAGDDNSGPTRTFTPLYQPGYGYGGANFGSGYAYRNTPVAYDTDVYSGSVSATDVDNPASELTWSVVGQAHHGSASIDNSGHWTFTGAQAVGGSDAFMVQVKDPSGKTDTLTITVPLPSAPDNTGDNGGGNYDPNAGDPGLGSGDSAGDPGDASGYAPIVLDLSGSGFHFKSVNESTAYLQSASDGLRHRTAWVDGGNGVLAFDKFGDGIVHDSSQISFKNDLPTAQTDLQGLAAFDSNHDGVIDKTDAQWGKLGAWVDANQDGVSDAGEYKTLDALGITSISLSSNQQFSVDQGVTVYGETSFTRADGTSGQAADVVLPTSADVLMINPDGSTRIAQVAQANPTNPKIVGDGNNLVLGDKGDNIISAGQGNNVISTGAGNDLIQAGNGNNTIMSGDGKDLIVVGSGDNTIMLGGGPKTVVVGKGNNLVTGGAGNNIIMAGNGNNTLYAGSGNSVVYAGNGDNSMVGGVGYNVLIAGNGNNQFTDGGGRADMHAGTGSNTFVVTNTLDTITVTTAQGTAQGINTVKTRVDWTLGANQKILWGTGSAALTLTGNDEGNQIIGNGAADTLIGGAGNDTLADSGGAATLIGGQGDDNYIVSNTATVVVEQANAGINTILSSVSYTASANVQNLTLTGRAAINGTGNALDNTLTGNTANNTLDGGAGNDTYILRAGGGTDTVQDAAGVDRVLVQGNYSAEDIVLTRRDQSVIVSLKGTSDSMVLSNWFSDVAWQTSPGQIESIAFENGSAAIDAAYINSLLDNHAPTAVADVAQTQADAPTSATGNVLSNDTDVDLPFDSRQHLTISQPGSYAGTYGQLELKADGSYTYVLDNSLPAVRALAVGETMVDTIAYTVQDNAVNNKTASATLSITIAGSNDAPGVATVIADQQAREQQAFSFTVPENTFSDPDHGDLLSYSAQAINADGSTKALPAWLRFDAATRSFSGTPGSADGGSFDFQVTATDPYGASISTTVTLDIADEFAGTGDNINVITGSWMNDTLNGTRRSETLIGNGGTDKLLAGEGDNTIISYGGDTLITAGAGADVITSSYGNDTIDAGAGNNRINAGGGDNLITTGSGDDAINTDWGMSTIHAGGGNNTVTATGGNTLVTTGSGNDSITTSWGADQVDAGDGNNTISTSNGDDHVRAGSGNDLIDTSNGRDWVDAGDGNNTISTGNDDDYVLAGSGADTIDTDNGRDIVQSGAGDDTIISGNDNDVVDAGAGNDTISAGYGDDWIAGGQGDDFIDGGMYSRNIFAFNKGDGADTISNSVWGSDTVSLGHGIKYADLQLIKSGNDLVLDLDGVAGTNDSVTFKDWYVDDQHKGVGRLQVITQGGDYDATSSDTTRNQQVEQFDFGLLVQRFDAARAANTNLGDGWAVMNGLLDAHLSGSDTQALGGDLSFQYASAGSLSGIDLTAAQASLASGMGSQTLQVRSQLERDVVRLA